MYSADPNDNRYLLQVGKTCNQNCVFCPYLSIKSSSDKSFEEIQRELDSIITKKPELVLPCNAEIRKDYFKILSYAKSHNFKITQLTSGRMFSYNDFARKASSFIDTFEIFVLGKETLHDMITRKQGFEQTIKGIVTLKRFTRNVQINTVITKYNYENLKDIIDITQGLNVKAVWPIFPIIKKETVDIPEIIDAFQYIEQMRRYARTNGIEIIDGKILHNPYIPKDLNLDYTSAAIKFERNKYKTKKDISIIVPTYNRKHLLELCILSLFHQEYPKEKYEIIIVDDGSDDNSEEIIKELNPTCNIKYIYWPRNKPYKPREPRSRRSAARNIGINNASGGLIIFFDSDNIAPSTLLQKHLTAHDGHNRLVLGLRYLLSEKQQISKEELQNRIKKHEIDSSLFTYDPEDEINILYEECKFNLSKLRQPWFGFISNNASILKKKIDSVGLLDDNFVYWGLEDQEFAYRCFKNGLEVYLHKNIRVFHQWHENEVTEILDRHNILKIQHQIFYKKFLDIEQLFWLKDKIFFETTSKNIKSLLHKKGLVWRFVSKYKKWNFSKEEFDVFLYLFYQYTFENKYQNNKTLEEGFKDENTLLRLFKSGFFKRILEKESIKRTKLRLPDKKTNMELNKAEFNNKETVLMSYPYRVYIELTRNCNLFCKMCEHSKMYNSLEYDSKLTMPLEDFKKVADELFPYAQLIDLRGFGESLLIPNLKEYVDYAKKFDADVGIVTNLSIKDDKLLDYLISKNTWLGISIDASDKKTHQKIRGGDVFDTIVDNIKLLVAASQKYKTDISRIYLIIVVQKDNVENLQDIVRFAKELGLKRIEFKFVRTSDPNISLDNVKKLTRKNVKESMKLSKESDIELVLLDSFYDRTFEKEEGYEIMTECSRSWSHATIDYQLNVGPCNHLLQDSFGNMKNKSFREVWNNPQFQLFRKNLNTEARGKLCKFCFNNYFNTDYS